MPVRWLEGGLDPEVPDHAHYVSDVISELSKHLRALVDTIIEEDQSKVILICIIILRTASKNIK